MTRSDLEAKVLQLEPTERVRLAHTIVSSLGQLNSAQIRELWLQEAERRDAELESGQVKAVPGTEVFARIRARHS